MALLTGQLDKHKRIGIKVAVYSFLVVAPLGPLLVAISSLLAGLGLDVLDIGCIIKNTTECTLVSTTLNSLNPPNGL